MIKISILQTAVLFLLLAALSLTGLDVSPEGAWTLEGISGSWRIAMPGWSRFLNAGTADFKTVAPGVGILTEQGKSMEFRSFCRPEGGESAGWTTRSASHSKSSAPSRLTGNRRRSPASGAKRY